MRLLKGDCDLLIKYINESPKNAILLGELGVQAFEAGRLAVKTSKIPLSGLADLVQFSENQIIFKNEAVCEFFIGASFAARSTDEISKTLNETNRLRFNKRLQVKPEEVQEYFLIILNRVHGIRVLDIFKNDLVHFFAINHTFNQAFTQLSVPVEDMLELLKIIAIKTENDMAGGGTYKLMEEISEVNPAFGFELFEKLWEPSNLTIVKYAPSIAVVLAKHNDISEFHQRAKGFLESDYREQIWAALIVIRNIPYESGSPLLIEAYESFKRMSTHMDDQVRAYAVQGICSFWKVIPTVITDLRFFANSTDVMHKFPIAVHVWQETKANSLSQEIKELSLALPIGNIENQNFFNYVNWHISDSYKLGEHGYALKLFRSWMGKGQKLETFEHALHTFKSDFPTFSRELTSWFNSSDLTLLRSLTTLTGRFDRYDFQLETEVLNEYSTEEISRVIGAVAGFVYSRKPLASLMVSILNTRHAEDHADSLLNILTDYICYTYPSTLDEHIKPEHRKAIGTKKKVLTEVIRRVNKYYKELRSLPAVPELFGSELRISEYMRTTSQNQEALMAATKSRNVFATFAQHVSLRTAEIWFTKHGGEYTDESKLEKMEYSFELPRAEFIDPANFEHFRMRMRQQALSK